MHTSTCTHTDWGVVLMTGFPPLPCQEECNVGNFFLTLGSTWGYFHVCWYCNGSCVFSTGLQVHLICIYNIQCILHVMDNAFCSFAPNTSFALLQVGVSLIYHWWVFASLMWFQAPLNNPGLYLSRPHPVFPLWKPCCYSYIIALAAVCVSPKYIFLCRITSCHHCLYKNFYIMWLQ